MNKIIGSTAALAAALMFSAPAVAAENERAESQPATAEKKQKAEIVQRGNDGRAQVVSIDGEEYTVCTREGQDSCINPRAAGLNWGGRELSYWPGQPASEINEPLPANPPG